MRKTDFLTFGLEKEARSCFFFSFSHILLAFYQTKASFDIYLEICWIFPNPKVVKWLKSTASNHLSKWPQEKVFNLPKILADRYTLAVTHFSLLASITQKQVGLSHRWQYDRGYDWTFMWTKSFEKIIFENNTVLINVKTWFLNPDISHII